MAEDKKVEVKTDDGLAAKVRHLEQKIDKMSANWKKFCEVHLGSIAKDGKVGSIRLGMFVVICLLAVVGFVVAADRDLVNWSGSDSATIGTAKIITDDAGAATLNVNAIKIGAQVGWTGVITNKMSLYTNLTWVGKGVITNVTLIGAMP